MRYLITGFILGCALLLTVHIFYVELIIPKEIELRARHLNLMHYDSVKDEFVENDTIIISGADLRYLRYGKTH